jgi:dolichol-phosphate mannosyltransferase
MKVVIIIPTYNEKGNIERIVPTLEEEIFPQIKNHEMAILVADDKSPDGTADEVKELMGKWSNIDLIMGEKQGLGAAYMRAMAYAIEKMGAEIMFEMDADLSHDPNKVPDFLKKIDEGADFVIGTRYSGGGSIPENWGLIRKIYSIFGNILIRAILMRFSIHDWTGGYRAIKKEVFLKESKKIKEVRNYTFQISFLHHAVQDGFKVAEVPIHFTDRTLGKSKLAAKSYIIDVLKYCFVAKFKELVFGPFGKFLVVGGTGFVIQAVIYNLFIKYTSFPLAFGSWIAAQPAIFSNFNLNNLWTFKEDKSKTFLSYIKKISIFFLTSNIGVLLIQSGIIYILENMFGRKYANYYFIFATAVLLVWNFTMYRFVIWRKKPHK